MVIYCDESGTHLDSEIAVMAGYIGTADQWCIFIRQWQHILDRSHVPYIHMNEIENSGRAEDDPASTNPYKGWSQQKKERFLKPVRNIIHGRTTAGFAAALRRKEFLSVLPEDMRTFLGGPYGWCAQAILNQVNQWREHRGITEPISWVFEKGHDPSEAKEVTNLFSVLQGNPEYGIRNFTFASGDLLPLQSADLLAYEVYRQAIHQYKKGIVKANEFHRREGRALVRKEIDFPNLEIWTKESLRVYLDKLPYSTWQQN